MFFRNGSLFAPISIRLNTNLNKMEKMFGIHLIVIGCKSTPRTQWKLCVTNSHEKIMITRAMSCSPSHPHE
jgi:hypothetical protein